MLKDYFGIQGKTKAFEERLLEKYDEPAREKVKNALGDIVADNPDVYAQDLIITSNRCNYRFLELQVCAQWINDNFPYPNVYIYARKIKYDSDTLFLTLNRDMTMGYLFDTRLLKKENRKPRRFKKYSREFVYDIPWHQVLKIHLSNVDQETVINF